MTWTVSPNALVEELAQATQPRSLRALYGWSSRFGWQARIAEIEGQAAAEDDERLRRGYVACGNGISTSVLRRNRRAWSDWGTCRAAATMKLVQARAALESSAGRDRRR